jgi:membrane protein implicated in regulation of membrane protease activity
MTKGREDMELVWWHWMILGLALGLLELVVPAFFVIWFGLGALLVGIVMLVAPDMAFTSQILLVDGGIGGDDRVLVPGVPRRRRQDAIRPGDEALGEIGVLVRAVEPLGSNRRAAKCVSRSR